MRPYYTYARAVLAEERTQEVSSWRRCCKPLRVIIAHEIFVIFPATFCLGAYISASCFMKQVYICFLCSSKLNNHGSSLTEREWNAMNIEAYPLLRLCQPVLSPISFHYHHNDDVLVTSGTIVFRVCLEGVYSDSTVLSSKLSAFSLAACCYKYEYSSGAVKSGAGVLCRMGDRLRDGRPNFDSRQMWYSSSNEVRTAQAITESCFYLRIKWSFHVKFRNAWIFTSAPSVFFVA